MFRDIHTNQLNFDTGAGGGCRQPTFEWSFPRLLGDNREKMARGGALGEIPDGRVFFF